MKKTNLSEYEFFITHNLDEYDKQLEKIAMHVQMLKNEIASLNKMKMSIDFNLEDKAEDK